MGSICPCPTAIRASGTSLFIISSSSCIFFILLLIKNTCPLRLISNSIASRIINGSNVCTSVCIGYLFGGGVVIADKSLAPINENCNVRGIGVAVIVKVSTLDFICFNFSFTATPNFCSSSIISKPKSLNCISLPTMRCVPISISTFPSFRSFRTSLICPADRALLIYSTRQGKSLSLSLNV